MTQNSKKVAVIGAGIAGLACAYELKKAGHEVVVYEKNDRPGGRMVTHDLDGLPFDAGAMLMSENYTTLRAYSEELGVRWVPMESGTTHRIIRDGGAKLLAMKTPLDILRLDVLSWRARLRFLWWLVRLSFRRVPGTFFDLSTLDPALDRESARDLLVREVGEEVADYIADPFTATLHFYRSGDVSAGMLYALLKMMLGNKEFSARWPVGGIQAIPNALAARLDVRYGAQVESIFNRIVIPDLVGDPGSGASVSNSNPMITMANGDQEPFDAVVFAAPAPVVRVLLHRQTQAQHDLLAAAEYAPTLALAFTVPINLFADHTHCVYIPYVESKVISAASFEARKGGALASGERTILIVYLHEAAARELFQKTDEEVRDIVVPELKRLIPELAALETMHRTALCTQGSPVQLGYIERWQYAMPKFKSGYVSLVRDFVAEHQGEGGIYFCGDYLNSPWAEGAARSGVRAAEAIKKLHHT